MVDKLKRLRFAHIFRKFNTQITVSIYVQAIKIHKLIWYAFSEKIIFKINALECEPTI